MIVVTGASAMDWHRTPPVVRDALMFLGEAEAQRCDLGIARNTLESRANACRAAELIRGRLFDDFKGVRLPVEIATDESSNGRTTSLLRPHRLSRPLPERLVSHMGDELYMASPALALCHMANEVSFAQLIMVMYECCGTYAQIPITRRTKRVLEKIRSTSAASSDGESREPLKDKRLAIAKDLESDWRPCLDRQGNIGSLWSRPPLMTVQRLVADIRELQGERGQRTAARAARWVLDGAASPLEAKWVAMVVLPPRYGGMHLPAPLLNYKIPFDERARVLAGMPYCVGDLVWPEQRVVSEVNGEAYHSDRWGFKEASGRRAALEAMGYTVIEVAYDQMRVSVRANSMLELLARALGCRLPKNGSDRRERVDRLHNELFSCL